MVGVEIDFVVKNCKDALPVYQSIFDLEVVEATDLPTGNEAIFTLYGTRFHILDENPDYQLIAPKEGDPKPMWLNIMVEDIESTYNKALAAGCTPIQPVTHMEAMGVANAMFLDPYGYVWMLHQVFREVGMEERIAALED